MPMGYNPQEVGESSGGGGRAEPGTYHFRVDDARELTFRSGNEGCEIKLAVAAFGDRDITVYDRCVYTSRSLWKLKQFFGAVGCDFERPPEVHELAGHRGRARFKRDENGYLVVAEYLSAQQPQAPQRQSPGPQQQRGGSGGWPPDDNLPF